MPWDLNIDKQYDLLFILFNFIIYYTIGCGTQLCFKIKIFFQTKLNSYPFVSQECMKQILGKSVKKFMCYEHSLHYI